jgi:hypothetical protein
VIVTQLIFTYRKVLIRSSLSNNLARFFALFLEQRVPVREGFVLDPVDVPVEVVVVVEAELGGDGSELSDRHEAEQGAVLLGNLGSI